VQTRKRTWVEVTALVLLSIGGVIVPVIGWLVGVVLLWVSDVWTTRDKLLGTFLAPSGVAILGWLTLQTLGSSESCVGSFDAKVCSGGPSGFERFFWPALLIALGVASIATTIYLVRRLRKLSSRATLA
jgi:hypothetical protein